MIINHKSSVSVVCEQSCQLWGGKEWPGCQQEEPGLLILPGAAAGARQSWGGSSTEELSAGEYHHKYSNFGGKCSLSTNHIDWQTILCRPISQRCVAIGMKQFNCEHFINIFQHIFFLFQRVQCSSLQELSTVWWCHQSWLALSHLQQEQVSFMTF